MIKFKSLATFAIGLSLSLSLSAQALELVTFKEDGTPSTINAASNFSPSASGESIAYSLSGVKLTNMVSRTTQQLGYYPGTDELITNRLYSRYMTANKRFHVMLSYDQFDGFPPYGYSSAQYLYDAVEDEYTAIAVDYLGEHQVIDLAQVSEDGKRVYFVTNQRILEDVGYSSRKQAYLFNVDTGETKLITKQVNGDLFDFAVSTSAQHIRMLSGDGRYFVFASGEDNAVSDQVTGNNWSKLYLYDAESDALSIVSADSEGNISNSEFSMATINITGQYIAVVTPNGLMAYNPPESYDSGADILVLDRSDQSWNHVTLDSTGLKSPRGGIAYPSISADGKYLAYSSIASDIDGDTHGKRQAFFVDTETRVSKLVSRSDITGEASLESVLVPVISENGKYVFFDTKDHRMIVGETPSRKNQIYRWENVGSGDFPEPELCEVY